ncbi:MAG: hypothetical protein Q9187_004839 [Circinaria calcarea]
MEHVITNTIDITQRPLIHETPFDDITPTDVSEHGKPAAEEKEEDHHPVPYQLFVTLTMSPLEIASLIPLGAFALSKTTAQQKALTIWMTLAIMWVIIYPTIASAMTGYINMVDPEKEALVKLHQPESTMGLVQFLSIANIAFQYATPQQSQGYHIALASHFGIDNASIITKDGPSPSLWESLNTKFSKLHYVPKDNETIFLSIYDNHAGPKLDGGKLNGDRSHPGDTLERNYQGAHFKYFRRVNNESYLWDYTNALDNVHCIQGLRYQWGFSSVLTITFLICNTIWLVGIWITWVSLQNRSQFAKKRREMGKYRAAVDVAEAIGYELGPNLSALSDSALEAALKKRSPIRYQLMERPEVGNEKYPRIALSSQNPGGERVKLEFDREYV